MSTETLGRQALFGQLRDAGLSATLANRLEELLNAEPFNGDLERFCAAESGKLAAAYNRSHPGTKGLGAKTFEAHDLLAKFWKQSKFDARQVAKETVAAQEAREAEKARMREELLDRQLTSENILVALDILEKLGQKSFPLRDLVEFHDRAARAKGGQA